MTRTIVSIRTPQTHSLTRRPRGGPQTSRQWHALHAPLPPTGVTVAHVGARMLSAPALPGLATPGEVTVARHVPFGGTFALPVVFPSTQVSLTLATPLGTSVVNVEVRDNDINAREFVAEIDGD